MLSTQIWNFPEAPSALLLPSFPLAMPPAKKSRSRQPKRGLRLENDRLKKEATILKQEIADWIAFSQLLLNGNPITELDGYCRDFKDLWWSKEAVQTAFGTFCGVGITSDTFDEHFEFRERGPGFTGIWVSKGSGAGSLAEYVGIGDGTMQRIEQRVALQMTMPV
jgi:hypothetical protein